MHFGSCHDSVNNLAPPCGQSYTVVLEAQSAKLRQSVFLWLAGWSEVCMEWTLAERIYRTTWGKSKSKLIDIVHWLCSPREYNLNRNAGEFQALYRCECCCLSCFLTRVSCNSCTSFLTLSFMDVSFPLKGNDPPPYDNDICICNVPGRHRKFIRKWIQALSSWCRMIRVLATRWE